MVGGVNCKSAEHRDAGVSRWGRKYLQGSLNAVFLILSEYSICLAPAGGHQPTAGASPSHSAVPGITSQPAGSSSSLLPYPGSPLQGEPAPVGALCQTQP